jgi:hypothetical protein
MVELIPARPKDTHDSLDTAIASDDERALVVPSDPALTLAPTFAETRTAAGGLKYVWGDSNR